MRKSRKRSNKYYYDFNEYTFPRLKKECKKISKRHRSKKLRGFKRIFHRYCGNDYSYHKFISSNSKYLDSLLFTYHIISEISYVDESADYVELDSYQSPLWFDKLEDLGIEINVFLNKIRETNENLIVKSIVEHRNVESVKELLRDDDRYKEFLKSHIPGIDILDHRKARMFILELEGIEPYLVASVFTEGEEFEVGMGIFKKYLNKDEDMVSLVHKAFEGMKSNLLGKLK